MAAVTSHFGTVALNGATEVSVTLNPEYSYHIRHTAVDAAANGDAQSQLAAFMSTTSGITATPAEADDKYALLKETEVTIGPGIAILYLDSTSGADGILTFSRQGSPTRAW